MSSTEPAAAGASTKENPRLAYATGSTGLALTVRGSSRRIMIMRFRAANIRLINRRSLLPRLLLALHSKKRKRQIQKHSTDRAELTRSLHIGQITHQGGAADWSIRVGARSCIEGRGDRWSGPFAANLGAIEPRWLFPNLGVGSRTQL